MENGVFFFFFYSRGYRVIKDLSWLFFIIVAPP